jgi:predicted transcriptional regulator
MEPTEKIRIGIMPQEQIRARMLAIASGSYKPESDEPKIWFTSMRSLAEVLSDENRALLRVIRETEPDSIKALSQVTGRESSNLSRTLKTMSSYGIVDLVKTGRRVKPVVKLTQFEIVAT